MALTATMMQTALAAMRTALPGAAVAITIRGQSYNAIERKGIMDADPSGMGVFPGQKGHFVLTVDPPTDLKDGETLTIERDNGRWETLRIVGIGRPYDGLVRIYYGDQYTRGRVS